MIVSIHQPAYLPWLGYLHRVGSSDLHIVLDHVQFEKNSFTNRNKVRTADGWCWLTVPLRTRGRFGDLAIRSLEIDNSSNWRMKHWRTLAQSYSRAPYFGEHAAFFEEIYSREWELLADLCQSITNYLLRSFGITTPLKHSSQMNPQKSKSELVLELCETVGADTYLSGILGRDYLNEESFGAAGVKIIYQDFQHPEYSQRPNIGFVSNMAAIDLLFNCGPESLRLIALGNRHSARTMPADGLRTPDSPHEITSTPGNAMSQPQSQGPQNTPNGGENTFVCSTGSAGKGPFGRGYETR